MQNYNILNSAQYLYTGIFVDERIHRLLFALQTLSDNCFSKLHEVANENNPSSTEYTRRFKKGLECIEHWNSETKMRETNYAMEQFPELVALYKYAIVRYLKELYKNEKAERIPVSIPPLPDFIHAYYVTLSKTNYMKKMEFLNIWGLERTHMHMEALRGILIDFTRHSVYQPNFNSSSYDNDYPVEMMNPNNKSYNNQPQHIPGLVRVEKDVSPWDSVSQRGFEEEYQDEEEEYYKATPKSKHHVSSSSRHPPLSVESNLRPNRLFQPPQRPSQYPSQQKSHKTSKTNTPQSVIRKSHQPIEFNDRSLKTQKDSLYDKATKKCMEDEEDALSPLSQTFSNHKENNNPINLSNKLSTPQTNRHQKNPSSNNITLTTPSKEGNNSNKPNDKNNTSNDKPKTIEVIKESTPIKSKKDKLDYLSDSEEDFIKKNVNNDSNKTTNNTTSESHIIKSPIKVKHSNNPPPQTPSNHKNPKPTTSPKKIMSSKNSNTSSHTIQLNVA